MSVTYSSFLVHLVTKENLSDREKKRMEDGKAISKLRQELNDQEIKKLAEERKREKMEAAEAKRRVLEQIEADKRARQMEREVSVCLTCFSFSTVCIKLC